MMAPARLVFAWSFLVGAGVVPASAQVPAGMMVTAEESAAVTRTITAEPRVRKLIGPGQPRVTVTLLEPDKAEAEAFLQGRSSSLPPRRAAVMLFNPEGNKAARAIVSLPDSRILRIDAITPNEVPFTREDGEQVLALAKNDPSVRRVVGEALPRYELLESGNDARIPFAAQVQPLRSTATNDPCRVDRCAGVIFRNENGYLALRVHVNLTRRSVQVQESQRQHR
jgi:Copper amine oxidase, N2 domain